MAFFGLFFRATLILYLHTFYILFSHRNEFTLKELQSITQELPHNHKIFLKILLLLLQKTSKFVDFNKMSTNKYVFFAYYYHGTS